ncbi:MAG: hypothetical protein QOE65_1095 [Solirubrobacteraceae bacterium]|jgi:DNA modification methylase|nr:hypothetical protein [Solirubrobacteraceae bacterium]
MEPVRFVDTGVLYCDDNLARLREFPDECVDLVYLDPPFFSNRNYEVIWGDEAEMRSFEDRWEGGIQHYVNWMKERLIELHRVLRPSGSLYLHCDWHASHHLKLMMDDVFEARNFQNEVIWYYKGGGSSPRRWSRKHDTIFFYTKGEDWTFNLDEVRTSYSEEILSRPKSSYRHHHYGSKDNPSAQVSNWDLNPKGKRPDDVWEMPIINPGARERLGYPTQKPEALLELIVKASSNPGDVVLDPFAGCGTTQVVAERLKREWIGIDISPTAVSLMQRRLLKATNGAVQIRIEGMPMTEADLRALKPFEFQNWVISRLNGTHSARKVGDMGIDGFSFMHNDPIQVKQSEGVGRNVIDNFETAIERAGKERGYVIAFSFTKGAVEEVARAKAAGKADIKLVRVGELITEKVEKPKEIPDLMQLFSTAELNRPLQEPRPKNARPSPGELVKSDQTPTPQAG